MSPTDLTVIQGSSGFQPPSGESQKSCPGNLLFPSPLRPQVPGALCSI